VLIEWLDVARKQLDGIVRDREGWSEDSARALRAAIVDRGDQVARFPRSGRMIPDFQMDHLREVLEQGFRIMYEVFPDRIEVFGVVHARRDVFGDPASG
jgi:plasmid stabilization system protein ParE